MSFSGRAGEALKGEAGGAEGLFYGPFAAVGYKQGAGCTTGSNGAEDCLIPQIGLGGRGECIIIHHRGDTCIHAPGMPSRFPIVFFPQISNVCTALV